MAWLPIHFLCCFLPGAGKFVSLSQQLWLYALALFPTALALLHYPSLAVLPPLSFIYCPSGTVPSEHLQICILLHSLCFVPPALPSALGRLHREVSIGHPALGRLHCAVSIGPLALGRLCLAACTGLLALDRLHWAVSI